MYSSTFKLKPGESVKVVTEAFEARIRRFKIKADVVQVGTLDPIKVRVEYGAGIDRPTVEKCDKIFDRVLKNVLGRKA